MKGPAKSSLTTPASQVQQRSEVAPAANISFKMPALDSLPSFSGGNFPQWLRSLKLHLRAGNDQGPEGMVILPPPALMVQIMEAKTTGDASATWTSAPLQAILAKEENITENDLNTVIKAFTGEAVTGDAPAPEEQRQENPASQLKNLSQGKNLSHQEYYKKTTSIMDQLGLEDTHYEDALNEAAEPLSLIQKAILSYYVQGIEDEQIRISVYFSGAETLGDAYEQVRKADRRVREARKQEQEEQEEMLRTMTGMSHADAQDAVDSEAARRLRDHCNQQ